MKERMCRQMSNDCCCCMMVMTKKGSVYIIGKEQIKQKDYEKSSIYNCRTIGSWLEDIFLPTLISHDPELSCHLLRKERCKSSSDPWQRLFCPCQAHIWGCYAPDGQGISDTLYSGRQLKWLPWCPKDHRHIRWGYPLRHDFSFH